MEDDTNPLFISAVRIFLEFVRDKHHIACPEKCTLDQLIAFLGEFQDQALTKKGERYSPSTIRVIRYSLNRVIALGRNQMEMRPYPTQSNGVRKKRTADEGFGSGSASPIDGHHYKGAASSGNEALLIRNHREMYLDSPAHMQAAYGVTKFGNRPTESTIKTVQHGVSVFRSWLVDQGVGPDFENFTKQQINEYLVRFFHNAKTKTGKDYTRSSMQTFRFAITQYLKQHAMDSNKDAVFEPSREAFRAVLRNLPVTTEMTAHKKRRHFDVAFATTTMGTEWLGIPVEHIKDIYRSGALAVSTAISLQRKVWFELTVFFRSIPCCPDQHYWTKNTFKIATGDQGIKYVELNPDMYNRYGHTIDRISEEGRIMVQRPGSPFCPVASFETYLRALDPVCDMLFTQPQHNAGYPTNECSDYFRPIVAPVEGIHYRNETLSPLILNSIMSDIAKAASIPFRFSCLSAAETDRVTWMRAMTAMELELQCQSPQRMVNTPDSVSSAEHGVRRFSVIHSAPRSFSRVTESEIKCLSLSLQTDEMPPKKRHLSGQEHLMLPQNEVFEIKSEPNVSVRESPCETIAVPLEVPAVKCSKDSDQATPGMKMFYDWCTKHGKASEIQWYSVTYLDDVLSSFFESLERTGNRSEDIKLLKLVETEINNSLANVFGQNVKVASHSMLPKTSGVFAKLNSDDVQLSSEISPSKVCPEVAPSKGHDRPQGLTVDEIKQLYDSGVFNVNQRESLQRKVLFELQLHFAPVNSYPRKLKLWTKILFEAVTDAEGRRYVSDKSTVDRPKMFERLNDRNCPAASFEKYMAHLPGTSKLLFPKCLEEGCSAEWYGSEASELSDVSAFLTVISKSAGFPRILTPDEVKGTPMKVWSDALDALHEQENQSRASGSGTVSPTIEETGSPKEQNSRPTVKRMLELYRKSKEAQGESEDSKEEPEPTCSTEFPVVNGSLFANTTKPAGISPAQSESVEKNSSSEPVVLVRPQIVIINTSSAMLEKDKLKELIVRALEKAVETPEWEVAIDNAISEAMSGRKSEPYQSVNKDLKKGHTGSTTSESQKAQNNNVATSGTKKFDSRDICLEDSLRFSPTTMDAMYEDMRSNSSNSSDDMNLHIECNDDDCEQDSIMAHALHSDDVVCSAPEDIHGSLRRKAFKPFHHSVE